MSDGDHPGLGVARWEYATTIAEGELDGSDALANVIRAIDEASPSSDPHRVHGADYLDDINERMSDDGWRTIDDFHISPDESLVVHFAVKTLTEPLPEERLDTMREFLLNDMGSVAVVVVLPGRKEGVASELADDYLAAHERDRDVTQQCVRQFGGVDVDYEGVPLACAVAELVTDS